MADRNATVSLRLQFIVQQLQDVISAATAVDRFGDQLEQSNRQSQGFSDQIQKLAAQSRQLLGSLGGQQIDQAASAFSRLQEQARRVADSLSSASVDEAISEYGRLDKELQSVTTQLSSARAASQALNDAIRGGGATEAQVSEYERLRRVISALKGQQQGIVEQQRAFNSVINQARTKEYADDFANLTRELDKVDDSIREVREESQRLNSQLNKGASKEQLNTYRQLQQRLRELRVEQGAIRNRLTETNDALRRSGVSTREYAAANAQLQSSLRRSRTELQRVANEAIKVRTALTQKLKDPTTEARGGVASLISQFTGLNTVIGALATGAGVAALARLGSASLESAKQIESLQRSLNSFAGSERAVGLIGELTDEASRLGVNVSLLSQPFAEFIAATKALNVEEAEALRLFGSFSESLLRTGKDAGALSDTLLGLNQSLRQGNLQYDEFRQIASRIPGAFEAASKAFNVTTAELKDFIATGNATFDEGRLVTFIEELGVATGNTGEEIEGIAQSEGRLANATTKLGSTFAQVTGFADLYKSAVEGLASSFDRLEGSIRNRNFAPEEGIAALTSGFDDAGQKLEEVRKKLAEVNKEVSKKPSLEGPEAIRAEIERLGEEYTKLQSQVRRPFNFGRSEQIGELVALRDRASELEVELKKLEALEGIGDLFDSAQADDFVDGISGVIDQIKELPANTKVADEALTQVSRGINALNKANLDIFRAQIEAARDEAKSLGQSTDNLDAIIARLAGESTKRANEALSSFASATKNASDKLAEGFDRLQADIKAKDDLAKANVAAAKAEIDIAEARLRSAEVNAELTGTEQARLGVVERQNALDEAKLNLSRLTAEQAQIEADNNQEKIRLINAEIEAQQSLVAQLRAKADAGDSSAKIQEQIEKQSQKIEKLKEEKVALESIAGSSLKAAEAAKARLAADEAATKLLKESEKAALSSASSYEEAAKAALKLLASTAGTERSEAARVEATKALGDAAQKEREEREKTTKAARSTSDAIADAADNTSRGIKETVKSTAAAQKVADAWNAATSATRAMSDETELLFRRLFDQGSFGRGNGLAQLAFEAEKGQSQVEGLNQKVDELSNRLREINKFEIGIRPTGVTQVLVDIAQARIQAEIAFREEQARAAQLQDTLNKAAANNQNNLEFLINQANRASQSFDLLDQEDLSGLQAAIDQSTQKLQQFQQQIESLDEQIRAREAELSGSGEEFRINERLKKEIDEIAALRENANGDQLRQLAELERIAKQNADAELDRIKERRRADETAAQQAQRSNTTQSAVDDYDRIASSASKASEATLGLSASLPVDQIREAADNAERFALNLAGAASPAFGAGGEGGDNAITAAQSRLSLYEQQIQAALRLRSVEQESAALAIENTERVKEADNRLTEQQINNRRRVAQTSSDGSGGGGTRNAIRLSSRRNAELAASNGDSIRTLSRAFVASGSLSG